MEVPEEKVVEIEEKIPAESVTEEDVRSELHEEVSENLFFSLSHIFIFPIRVKIDW